MYILINGILPQEANRILKNNHKIKAHINTNIYTDMEIKMQKQLILLKLLIDIVKQISHML